MPVNLDHKELIEKNLVERNHPEYQAFVHSFKYIKEMPKSFKGNIENGIYSSADQSFTIKVPSLVSTADKKLKIQYIEDGNTEKIDFVIFGPSELDYNIYHAVKLSFPFRQGDKLEYVHWLIEQKIKGRNTGLKQKHFEQFQLNGFNAYYAIYESKNGFFTVCIIDRIDDFYEVEIDISKTTKINNTNLDELINRKFLIFNQLLDSFKIK